MRWCFDRGNGRTLIVWFCIIGELVKSEFMIDLFESHVEKMLWFVLVHSVVIEWWADPSEVVKVRLLRPYLLQLDSVSVSQLYLSLWDVELLSEQLMHIHVVRTLEICEAGVSLHYCRVMMLEVKQCNPFPGNILHVTSQWSFSPCRPRRTVSIDKYILDVAIGYPIKHTYKVSLLWGAEITY